MVRTGMELGQVAHVGTGKAVEGFELEGRVLGEDRTANLGSNTLALYVFNDITVTNPFHTPHSETAHLCVHNASIPQ